jgi:uncharacterized membrane protein YeaQ/YmgE (transglycosylase-associated protein family)
MGILTWILLGLVAGALAKWIMPGPDPGGWIVTILIGIGGALGFGGVSGFNIGSILIAVLGALILLFAYRKLA